MQVKPDWQMDINKEQFEVQFKHKFEGPGFYLTKTDTLLLVPVRCDINKIWHKVQECDYFIAYVYNVPIQETIFYVQMPAPVRLDERS